jgi:hypothetical protein
LARAGRLARPLLLRESARQIQLLILLTETSLTC